MRIRYVNAPCTIARSEERLLCEMVKTGSPARSTNMSIFRLPFGAMMVITQAVLIAIYKFNFLSESIILFLVIYYIFICAVMAVMHY